MEREKESENEKLPRNDSSSAVCMLACPSSWSLTSTSPLLPRTRKRSITVSSLPSQDSLNKRDQKGRTPLFYAVRDNDREETKLFLDRGAKVNITDNYNLTPLHEATEKLNGDIIELLLEYGADINAKNILGQTPLMRAVLYDDLDTVKLLHHSGADLDATDCTGKTGLMIGLQEGGRVDVCTYLMKHNCAVNLVDKLGQSTLYIALRCCKNPSPVLVRRLLKAGYDVKRDNAIWLKMSELNRYTLKRKSFLEKVKDKMVHNHKARTNGEKSE